MDIYAHMMIEDERIRERKTFPKIMKSRGLEWQSLDKQRRNLNKK